ncbi:recombinase family protein [Citricoccus nitrophenolicus]|uniref:recombinase family protein n=1 Tax=Citricoccus nitrophenolicus TaxID=863575 RepID=UPI0031EA68AB
MKAVIYTRVSRDRSGGERSVTEQEEACRQFCLLQGWEVSAVYTDNDISASRFTRKIRPQFEVLIGELPKFGVLVTWEASRATRDLDVYAKLRRVCRDHGVLWAYSGRVYDLSRGDDAFSTGLEMLLSERSSDDTSSRIRRTVKSQAVAGKPHGRVPFGYRREYDSDTGKLLRQVPDEREAPVIREAARRVLSGESIYSICRDFEKREVEGISHKKWDTARIKRVLTNPTYMGKRVFRGEVIGDADWEPLLSTGTFEALAGVFAGDKHKPKYHGTGPRHLLTGLARCGVCGSKVSRIPDRKRGKESYICREGWHVGRRKDWADELVTSVVLARLRQPDALQAVNRAAGPEAEELATRLRTLEQRLEGFYVQAGEGGLSPTGLARVEERINREIEDTRASLRAVATPNAITIPDPVALADTWDRQSLIHRREVIDALMTVEILPAKVGSQRFDPETIRIAWKSA